MNTPIIDFLEKYSLSSAMRLHMPGHKGKCFIGPEKFDITEIKGADSLYEADGIIKQSEENASFLFGSHTFYSAEGSSLAIRAMLYLAKLWAKEKGLGQNKILAGRNAHKTFVSALALLDIEPRWLYPQEGDSYLSSCVDADETDKILSEEKDIFALYITSPDYLGNICDIKELSKVCKKHDVMLLVDNAHGAYLKFLPDSLHPTDLGADMCCDSAHKTLPVLTGGAYLHISKSTHQMFFEKAKYALSLFGSTSPSYLIMASLDYANEYIDEGYRGKLSAFIPKVQNLKNQLQNLGFSLFGDEVLKITVRAKEYGYEGFELAELLREENIECEFSDPDYLVLMISPEMTDSELEKLFLSFSKIPKKEKINTLPPNYVAPEKKISMRDACFSPSERLPVEKCSGKTLASLCVSCPPAVSYIMCGEKIDENTILMAKYYNTHYFEVVKHE